MTKASFASCCLIPPESVEIALDALYTIEIVKDGFTLYPQDTENKDPARNYAFDVRKKYREKFKEAIANYNPGNSDQAEDKTSKAAD